MTRKLASQAGPFALIPAWVLDSGISSKAVHLYAVLARHADADTHTAFPSRARLAQRMHCSLPTVDAAVKELVEAGALAVERRKNGKENLSNLWTIVLVRPGQESLPPSQKNDTRGSQKNRTENENHLEQEPPNDSSERKRSAAQQERDRIWDALEVCFGKASTPSEESRRGKVVSELVKAGATPPAVIGAHAEAKRRAWSNFSEMALVRNWTSLRQRAERRPSTADYASGNY